MKRTGYLEFVALNIVWGTVIGELLRVIFG